MDNKIKHQDSISKEDLAKYLNFVLTGSTESEKDVKDIKRLSRRTTTLADTTIVAQMMTKFMEGRLTQLMDVIQVQQRVLERLGANEEMFLAAQDAYFKDIEDMRKELELKAKTNKDEDDGKIQNETSND